ncbi:MFS transporter [Pseudomonas eucalypticola]|uniref:MFS transporter n=1 Tax=Pseudomonas eucalypticola TaxID=2599595 RepID=A0A7D5H086_9PSED|nr:MFS transporter [Pseudomonas eucalypticola]QKZ04467.1 MFS transporter [Pseudomonas eucalypticola]
MNAPSRVTQSKATFATYLLLLINCLSPMAAIVVAPSLPQMQAHFAGVPNVEFLIPVALTIPGLLVALLSPVVGILADRYGRKRLLVASIVGYGIFGLLPMFLDSLYAIIVSRVALGCVESVVVTVSTMLIGDYYSGAQRQKYLALQTTFASSSAILFFMVGGALGEIGWRAPYVVYAVPLLLALVSKALLWEPKAAAMADAEERGPLVSFRPLVLLGICVVTFIGAVMFMILQIQMAYLLGDIGEHSPQTAGLVASACSVMIVLGTLSVHMLARLGLRIPHCLALAFGLIAASFIAIPAMHTWQGIMAVALVNGLGCGLMLPTLAIWNMRELPWQRRGLGTGMWYGSYCLGMFFSPLLVVAVSKSSGSLATTVSWAGGLCVLVVLAALGASLVKRRAQRDLQLAAVNLEDA